MLSLLAIAGIFKGILMFLFILVCFLLVAIILLQEGKGGGLGGAFGGAGAETFGVQSGGVNRFTAWIGGTFFVMAILYAAIRPPADDSSVFDQPPDTEQPAGAGGAPGAPAGGVGNNPAEPTDGDTGGDAGGDTGDKEDG